jgi:hypothetical protein
MHPQKQMEIFLSGKQSLKFVATQPSHRGYMELTEVGLGIEKSANQKCKEEDNQTSTAACMF